MKHYACCIADEQENSKPYKSTILGSLDTELLTYHNDEKYYLQSGTIITILAADKVHQGNNKQMNISAIIYESYDSKYKKQKEQVTV